MLQSDVLLWPCLQNARDVESLKYLTWIEMLHIAHWAVTTSPIKVTIKCILRAPLWLEGLSI